MSSNAGDPRAEGSLPGLRPLAGTPGAPPRLRVKCLIVDDTEENLIALDALLRSDDVEVLMARSGAQALELLLVHDVALALLDVQMPEMNGFELAELIRGSIRTRHVPLIFVTAGARDQHRLFQGYDTGAVDFLYKPIDPFILANKASVFFELYRQRQALAHELQERTETLRMNEMFVAVLGHDLRSPLLTVLGSAALLQRHPEDAVTVLRTAERLKSTAQRMSRMVEDLLDVARARLGGGIVLAPAPADLGTVIERAVQELQDQRGDGVGNEIQVTRQGDLRGNWDSGRLAQAVVNLIGNALQHGQKGSPVSVSLDGSDAQLVRLTVSNAGCIGADLLPHIFNPFRRAESSTTRAGGLGLGLYIVRQIVLAHRGDIVASSLGDTRFEVTLPRRI